MKVFTVFVLVLAGLVPTGADSTQIQTWSVTTGCNPELNFGTCFDPAQMSAVLTTTMETGTFFDTEGDFSFTGTVPVVTNIVGTFDGFAMTLIPNGTGDWLNNSLPEDVEFSAGGNIFDIWVEGNAPFMQEGSDTENTEQIGWRAVEVVPEPDTLLFFTVPLLLALMRWAQLNLPKIVEPLGGLGHSDNPKNPYNPSLNL